MVNDEDAQQAAQALLNKGVENVLLTLGSKGSLLANCQMIYRMPAFTLDVKDSTAAGDVFNGALCVAMAEGPDWENSLDFASLAAAISVTRMGAQPSAPTREEVISLKTINRQQAYVTLP